MEKRALIWFRNDLRIRDNVVLEHVSKSFDKSLSVYFLDPGFEKKNKLGFVGAGDFRLKFLWESLEDLKKQLKSLGSDLIILKGKAEEIIPKLCDQYEIQEVVASKEVAWYESQEQENLEKILFSKGKKLKLFWQSTLFHEDDIPWPIQKLPDIFTQFRKENEKTVDVRPEKEAPQQLPRIDHNEISVKNPGIKTQSDDRTAISFVGGESAAWGRLEEYFWNRNKLKNYKYTRNGLLGEDYSSKLSPWLALGCVSPRSIYFEVKKYESERVKNVSTYWLIFELIWRDYFRFVTKKYGRKIFLRKGIKSKDPFGFEDNIELFEKWRTGNTGVPFIDANMRELLYTGFMSNRGRQNVASFLVKDLNIDWRWGASWFESQLIDYDVYSNWGNWIYVAGVGNDPREHRYFNILSQAQKYDSKGEYVRHWVPELAEVPGFKAQLPHEEYEFDVDYPRPVVDMGKWVY